MPWNLKRFTDMETDLISCVRYRKKRKIEFVDISEFHSSIIILNVG